MSDKTIELNRRRVLGGIVTIGGAAAAAGAGTFAFFSDTSSDSNTVDAGTLDLGATSGGNLSITDAVPTDTTSGTVSATYSGSVDAEIDADFSITESSTELTEPSSNNTELNATEFAQLLEVTTASVDIGSGAHTEDLLASVSDANGNGYVDLDDLVTAAPFDSVTGNNAVDGETVDISLALTFRSDAGNSAQADGVDIQVAITAEQPGAD